MTAFKRVLIAMISALLAGTTGMFVSAGAAHAGLDNELSLVDGQD